MNNEIVSIVLTGGPCSGKSTAMAKLVSWLMDLGFTVAVVPEAATELLSNGIKPTSFPDQVDFQNILLKNILSKENMFREALKLMHPPLPGRQRVLLCDRGIVDIMSYVTEDVFETILRRNNVEIGEIEKRYNMAIHLVTAADGAEEYYTTQNNLARTETPEEARRLDRKNQHNYVGYVPLRIVDNSTGFDKKMQKVMRHFQRVLSIPEPRQYQRKFLVKFKPEDFPVEIPYVVSDIEQTYLREGEKVRKRTQFGVEMYFHTTENPAVGFKRVKVERIISKEEYERLISESELRNLSISKTRYSFVCNNRSFRLDKFRGKPGQCILECDVASSDEVVFLPDFISVEREVTDDPQCYNFHIARSGGIVRD